jgi:membrane fusion protein (multidrug efflux system)
VSATIQMKAGKNKSTTIPAEALILDREGAYVFVAKGGKAHIKHVKTGLRTPFSVEITSGLSKGDTVIVSGIISLREGVDVNIKEIRHAMNYEVD